MTNRLSTIPDHFAAPIAFSFAYGSNVFAQKQSSGYDSLTDFVFAVDQPELWHTINMRQNPEHYSFLANSFGPKFVSSLQNYSGGVYYNAYVKIAGMNLKYGIISAEKLHSDLVNWDSLYIAGRMHKPIKILANNRLINQAIQINLVNALRLGLLLVSFQHQSSCSLGELFTCIAGISYIGDFRMLVPVFENPNKVKNIVSNQYNEFKKLYEGPLFDLVKSGQIRLDKDVLYFENNHRDWFNQLPLNFSRGIPLSVPASVHLNKDFNDALRNAIKAKTQVPAVGQSLKGIFSAGLVSSMDYCFQKVKKAIKK